MRRTVRVVDSASPFFAHPAGVTGSRADSLDVDAQRGRAYTHLWKDKTLALDLKTRAIAAHWPNRCADSRAIALNAQRGLLFAGCAEASRPARPGHPAGIAFWFTDQLNNAISVLHPESGEVVEPRGLGRRPDLGGEVRPMNNPGQLLQCRIVGEPLGDQLLEGAPALFVTMGLAGAVSISWFIVLPRIGSVVIPRLEESYLPFLHEIDHPMLLGETARPGARQEVFQGFGFTEPLEGIAEHRLDHLQ